MKPESNPQLYACVHAPEFPLQALRRLRPELHSEALAILEGRPPIETVCSLNTHALKKGTTRGMTRLEAESIDGLRLLARSEECESAARSIFLESAANFSPRMEASCHGTSRSCILDITGTVRLFGPPEMLAERLRTALAAAGFRVSIAVSANFHAARLKAAASRGITVIPPAQEAASLARLPIALLDLAPDHAETFATWGIQTLGALAALPPVELIARLGVHAEELHHLACGSLSHTFQPIEAEFSLKEFMDFETPVDQSDSLLFVAARMIDCLVARASARALSLASLEMHMMLAGGQQYRRIVRPAIPATDRKFLLKLLQLEIAAHPPQAPVQSLTLTAEAGQSSQMQLGLFAPQMPEPSRLDVTIARLKAIAGEDRVGSPVLEDTHRPGSFRMENFSIAGHAAQHAHTASTPCAAPSTQRMVLRRMRPPVPVRVELQAMKPVAFRENERCFKITAAYGPWKTSGNWWSTDGWNAEEWDILAESTDGASIACLLVNSTESDNAEATLHYNLTNWQLEAIYD